MSSARTHQRPPLRAGRSQTASGAVSYQQLKDRETHSDANPLTHTNTRWVIVCQNADEWCSHNIVEHTMIYSCTAPGNKLFWQTHKQTDSPPHAVRVAGCNAPTPSSTQAHARTHTYRHVTVRFASCDLKAVHLTEPNESNQFTKKTCSPNRSALVSFSSFASHVVNF